MKFSPKSNFSDRRASHTEHPAFGHVRKFSIILIILLGLAIGLATPLAISASAASPRPAVSLHALLTTLEGPKIQPPAWVIAARPQPRTINYTVTTHGALAATTNVTTLDHAIAAILNDPRGWSQLGLTFQQVSSGASLKIILSAASRVPDFSATGCSAALSCTVGNDVIINDARWETATAGWLAAGGTLSTYRQMVLNHEVGHWLGHPHISCNTVGDAAPVMRANGAVLDGCTMNAWPLASELWTTRLDLP